ncbi:unnamed protein product, partial [Clonostachys solani]
PSSHELAINTQRPPPRASRFFWPFSPSSEPQFKHDDVLAAHPSTVDGGTNAHPHWPRDSTDDQRFHSNQRVEVDFRREKMASWSGQPSVRGNSETTRMVLLTFSAIGVAFTWGMEMTYCTPYLLNLGLTKSNTSLVWIAGPLSGLIVQPVVGVISDESKSRWGRRRPLIVIGTIIVALSLLVLGFTKEIVGLFQKDEEKARRPTIVLAVLAIYVVDFAINSVMSCSRSLVVDTLPIEKQQTGAAWFSRMSAVGNLIGYAAGAVDMVKIFGTTFGDTQFKQLTIMAVFAITTTNALTCWAVTERVLISPKADPSNEGRLKVFKQIWNTISNLPPRIKAICWAQFWSWIGWFPFLFYSTTWVGETYFRYDAPKDAKSSTDALGDMGRIGSTALVIYSAITFAGAFVLPFLVESPEDQNFTRRPPKYMAGFLVKLETMKPNLLTAWICGHLMFSCAMSLAPFATSFRFATLLVCLCGLPWTLASWAPSAFLGVEVNRLGGTTTTENGTGQYRRLSDASDIEMPSLASGGGALHLEHDPEPEDGGTHASTGELSGIYFGILNIFTTLPQFVGTFISMIVFSILEPGKSPELANPDQSEDTPSATGPNAISVCLFIGAMSTLYAAYATRKLKYL